MEEIVIEGKIKGIAESRIGGRRENQDSFVFSEIHGGILVVVCDGMGGGPGGKLASSMTCEIVEKTFISLFDKSKIEKILVDSLSVANDKILKFVRENRGFIGMGTTCVCAFIIGGNAYVAHVGDSRFYLVRGGKISGKTQDHSYVEEMVRRGTMTEEEARTSNYSNIITRGIGIDDKIEPDIDVFDLLPGDRVILMTDGIWGMLPEKYLIKKLTLHDSLVETVEEICDNIDLLGKDNGSNHDNMTIVILEITKSIPSFSEDAIDSTEDDLRAHNVNNLPEENIISHSIKRLQILVVVLSGILLISLCLNLYFIYNSKSLVSLLSQSTPASQSFDEKVVEKSETDYSDNQQIPSSEGISENLTNNSTHNPDKEVRGNLEDVISLFNELKNFGKGTKYNSAERIDRITGRKRICQRITNILTKTLNNESDYSRKQVIEQLTEDIEGDNLLSSGIDRKWGHTTKETLDHINKFIERLKSI